MSTTDRNQDNTLIAIWLLASLIAVIPALNVLTAALVGGEYIPVGNDSLYHARRILDAAVGERGFYQFDDRIHLPEGSWITWPWAYDYFMAALLKVALWIRPEMEPTKFLAYVPVAWILINMGLLALLGRSLKLPVGLIAVVLFGFALSPLTQLLHGVGVIDHHFMELTFVLFAVWSGIAWVSDPGSRFAAARLGIALGIACGAHNSLFILQLPILIAAGILWLRSQQVVFEQAHVVAASLFVSALAIVLPSEPFRELFFEFATLSGFHLYVAFCSAAVLLLMQRLPFSWRNLAILAMCSALLAIPLLLPFIQGANYIAGGQVALEEIAEVQGPIEQIIRDGRLLGATRFYGYLIFLLPLILIAYLWLLVKSREPRETLLAVAGVMGLVMLGSQLRFHPFGYWALLLGFVYFASRIAGHHKFDDRKLLAGVAVVLMLSMQPAIQHQLLTHFVAGGNREYAVIHPAMKPLADACKKDPGVVLASRDEGHPIRYHTECSVIANNFLLTPQHGEKHLLASHLLSLPPEELKDYAPGIRYVLVHLYSIYKYSPDGPIPTPEDELKAANAELFNILAIDGRIPDNFELMAELRTEDERRLPYVQLYRVHPTESPAP